MTMTGLSRSFRTVTAISRRSLQQRATLSSSNSSWGRTTTMDDGQPTTVDRPAWTPEWKELGLGCTLVDADTTFISNLMFVQMGFGVDQHGDSKNTATKAAIRAVRNAIEFNSIPGVVEAIPGGRKEMLIHVKLGIPPAKEHAHTNTTTSDTTTTTSPARATTMTPMTVDPLEVAKVFPYGRLLPVEQVVGGLSFATGRLVPELGDEDDMAVCVAACVSIGYHDETKAQTMAGEGGAQQHAIYSTKDGQ